MKKRVLILCTGNSCRSQMAEALWMKLGANEWVAHSAGSKPTGYVHPLAIRIMRENGIDIAANRSKHVNECVGQSFDLVVTVCDGAKESCPVLPGAKRTVHWPFSDPATASGTDAEKLAAFRQARDDIEARIKRFFAEGL